MTNPAVSTIAQIRLRRFLNTQDEHNKFYDIIEIPCSDDIAVVLTRHGRIVSIGAQDGSGTVRLSKAHAHAPAQAAAEKLAEMRRARGYELFKDQSMRFSGAFTFDELCIDWSDVQEGLGQALFDRVLTKMKDSGYYEQLIEWLRSAPPAPTPASAPLSTPGKLKANYGSW